MMRKWLFIVICACALVSCKEYTVSDDPSMRLSFSCDTLRFDTIFTDQGSATSRLMVYNRNNAAIEIERVSMSVGAEFHINIDGESAPKHMTHFVINGHDSAFVFVRVDIDPNNENNPFLVTDQLHFHLQNGGSQSVQLEAYGQNVHRLKGKDLAESFTNWFDELYLGKYDVIPFFKIYKHTDEIFRLKVHIKNRQTGEDVLIDKLYTDEEVFGAKASDIARIVEKQLNYALRYMPELEELFEDEEPSPEHPL